MTDKSCGNCLYNNCDCHDVVGLCDEYDKWRSIDISDNPFNTQVGGDHYKKVADCPDVAEWCGLQKVEFLEGNVIKYVFRHERKNGFEDIEKAMQYLRFIAWVKYNKTL